MDELSSINVPWILESSDVLKFELSLLPLDFDSSLTVASILLHPYRMDDTTS